MCQFRLPLWRAHSSTPFDTCAIRDMLFDPNVAGSSSSTSSRSLEFIAVILAGESSATSNSGNTYIEAGGEDDAPEAGSSKDGAKASNGLLPPILQQVEGKPRIDGLLKWIEEAGVSGESGCPCSSAQLTSVCRYCHPRA